MKINQGAAEMKTLNGSRPPPASFAALAHRHRSSPRARRGSRRSRTSSQTGSHWPLIAVSADEVAIDPVDFMDILKYDVAEAAMVPLYSKYHFQSRPLPLPQFLISFMRQDAQLNLKRERRNDDVSTLRNAIILRH